MARINIEDQFFVDVCRVASKMGDADRAMGHALRFFRYAQTKHAKGLLITEEEFKREEFSEALFPVFAERVEGGIQAVGAKKHFSWLAQKIEAGSRGGKVSAARPRDASGRLLKSKTDPSELQAESKLSQPSSSSSYSSSLSHSPIIPSQEGMVSENKLSTRKVISASLRQNVSFQQKDLNQIHNALDQLFGEEIPRRKEIGVAILASVGGDGDRARAELQKIYEIPECRGKGIPKEKRYAYVLSVIEKRFGI